MNSESNTDSTIAKETGLKQYQAPKFTDYGKMSELTQAMPGNVGDDGGYPSFTASVVL